MEKKNNNQPVIWRPDVTILIIVILTIIGIILSQVYIMGKTPWEIELETFRNFISTELQTFATILGLFIVFIIFRLEKIYDIERVKLRGKKKPILENKSSIQDLVWTVRRVLIILILIVIICILCLPFVDTIIDNPQRTFFIVFYLICLSIWGIIEMTVSVTKLIFGKSILGMWEISKTKERVKDLQNKF